MVLRFHLGLCSQLPTPCCVGSCQKIYIVVLGVDLSFAVDNINVLWFKGYGSCSVSSLVYLNGPTLDICCERRLCVIELFVFCFILVDVLMLVYGSFMCI